MGVALGACAEPGAGASVYDLEVRREGNGTLVATSEIVAFARGGGAVGTACASVHYLAGFYVPEFLKNTPSYGGAFEEQRVCRDDLEDGTVWAVRFTSTRTDIPPGALVRVQVFSGGALTSADERAP